MKKILLWDMRFPQRVPIRLNVDDSVASAIVRSGAGAAADPAQAGALSAGAALDPGMLTEVVLQHGIGGTARVFLPYSVVLVGAVAGVLASIGTPIAGSGPGTTTPGQTATLTANPVNRTIAADATSGTLLFAIGNVPAGVTPTVSPNDGRFAIAGDATNGWKVVTGLSALSAGSVNVAVSAAGATGVSVPVTIVAATATLNALTVSNGSGTVGTALSSTISGLTSGSSVALTGAGAAGLSISGAVITGTPTTAGAVNLVETLAGATNSPNPTNGVITIAASTALPKFRAAMSKSKAGTGLTRIVMMGNSAFAGVGANGSGNAFVKSASTPTLLASKIAARGYNTNVESFFSDNGAFTVNNDPVATYDPRISYTSWTFAKPANNLGNITLAGTILQASVAGATFNFAPATAFDTFELYYFESTSAGNLQIKVDGTVVQTLNQQNSSPSAKKVVIRVAKGTHTLAFTSATSANVFIAGVIAYDSTQSPVIVINAGKSGGYAKEATSQYWYGQLPILQVIAPDLTVIAEDINEWAYDAANTSGYLTALQGIVTSAKVSGDAILCTNFSSQTTGSYVSSLPQATQDSIAAVTRQAAASASGVPLIDMYVDLGTGDAAAAAGKMFDQLHRNATGYAEVATYLDGKIAALAGL